jgi:hypothetical protein
VFDADVIVALLLSDEEVKRKEMEKAGGYHAVAFTYEQSVPKPPPEPAAPPPPPPEPEKPKPAWITIPIPKGMELVRAFPLHPRVDGEDALTFRAFPFRSPTMRT